MDAGARHVGWKIGRGIVEGEEHLEPVVGYLTSATLLEPGGVYESRGVRELRVDAEAAAGTIAFEARVLVNGEVRDSRRGCGLR